METTAYGPLKERPLCVIDLHTHISLKNYLFNRKFWKRHIMPAGTFPLTLRTDLDALIDGGVKALLCTVYVLEKGWFDDVWPLKWVGKAFRPLGRIATTDADVLCHTYMDLIEAQIRETRKRRGDVVEIARSYSEMRQIMDAGKVCILHAIEGAHHLAGKLENLEVFFERGVCQMIIPHMYPNEAGQCVNAIPTNQPFRKIGCFKEPFDVNAGITEWGRQLVDRMFEIGMIVDITHGTLPFRKAVLDMAALHPKRRPVIISHSGISRFCPAPLNPTDEEIKRIADTGGVVGLLAMTHWLSAPEQRNCLDVIMASVDHLVQVGGEGVVAFGSDFDGFTGVPADWRSPRDYNRIRAALLKKYTEDQVARFLSGNAERVLREGWGKQ